MQLDTNGHRSLPEKIKTRCVLNSQLYSFFINVTIFWDKQQIQDRCAMRTASIMERKAI